MLYSVVYRSRDAEYHEDTVLVTDNKAKAKRFAKRYAKERDVILADEPSMWLYTWKDSKVIDQTRLDVIWRKEH